MNVREVNAAAKRQSGHGVHELFPGRWSPRAMTGEPVSESDLKTLFEAARWAPSSYNSQPWRFVYAHRDSEHWDRFFGALVEFNQSWCEKAGVLVIISSRSTFEKNGKPAPTHQLDTGSAWMSMALQGSMMGLVVHGMQGFDSHKAAEAAQVRDPYHVLAMAAIGHPGEVDDLPEGARKQELPPSDRKKLEEIMFEGRLKE